jgi:colicin import membrane protein
MWRGGAQRLGFLPEDGVEVIATGKLTTYPGRSNYQIVIERMEIAGEGALLALLEKTKARLAAEEAKRQQDALVEQQRLDELKRQQEAEEQRKREEAERRKREEEARRKREQEAELERKRREAELERQREIERQRAENERKRREAEELALQSAVNEEAARMEAMNSTEMAAYQFALQQKVLRNWARPASAQAGLDCLVQVRQSATGEVISARVVSCNGDAAVERSIEAAVYKASPLPLPDNRLLFDPNLRFRFIPEQ